MKYRGSRTLNICDTTVPRAAPFASIGVESNPTIESVRTNKTAAATKESIKKRLKEFPVTAEIFLLSFAPSDCPTMTVVPMARPTIITVTICII